MPWSFEFENSISIDYYSSCDLRCGMRLFTLHYRSTAPVHHTLNVNIVKDYWYDLGWICERRNVG
jgi:hypothetical protein